MKNAKILIVEDEVIIALELKSVLQNLGYEVTAIVDNGEKAIRKTEEASPDIILMDIRIKGPIDGIETAEIIRHRFQIPVVFSTAYLDDERIERAKITMPFGYVLKPIQERDLRVTIEMALFTAQFDRERKETEQALARVSEYLETKPDEYDNEFRLVTANGDYRWIRAKARVVERDQDGNAIRMIGNHEDITETKWATEKLVESEKRLIQAQKLAKIGHWDWFMDTGELRWSDEVYTIFGRSKEDFQVDVASFEAAMHPDDHPAFIEEREKALAENRDVRIEHRILRPDGSIRWVREIAEILRDALKSGYT